MEILRERLGIDGRTLERWRTWWLVTFVESGFWKEARARFAGQQPLIEIRKDDEPLLHRDALRAVPAAPKLDTLRVLAYDTRAGKLVHVSIPFWLLRLAPSRHMTFLSDSGIDFDSDRVHITLDDLERRGPGLILDQADRRGSQVLVWAE